jgi:hypothetical protein
MTPNMELIEIYPEGNRFVAALRNTMTDAEEERLVDRADLLGHHPVVGGDLDEAAALGEKFGHRRGVVLAPTASSRHSATP